MTKRIIVVLLLLLPILVFAQRKRQEKPVLLVYGSDIEAFVSAVQSAKSNVPTLWVIPDNERVSSLTLQQKSISANHHLDGGIWMDLLMHIGQSKTKSDSLAIQIKNDISPQLVRNAIEKMTQDLFNLTIVNNTKINKLDKGKRGWQIALSNKQKLEVRTIVDATHDNQLSYFSSGSQSQRSSNEISKSTALSLARSRTTVAVGESGNTIYAFTLQDILNGEKENFFTLDALKQFDAHIDNIPLRAHYAQAVGAAAAYTAFFKTTSDKIDVRKLQTELITYGARLNPYLDIPVDDSHFNSFQKIYLTGLFENDDNLFHPSDSVRFEEVSPVLNQLYSRSQLWFLDNKGEYLSWQNILSLIKFVNFRGDEIDKQIEREWEKKLKFEGVFDPERKITRREFAIIADVFGNIYVKAVTKDGEILR